MEPNATVTAPTLPRPRGPRSGALIDALRSGGALGAPSAEDVDPMGEDLHLALYVAYELHYRGFRDVAGDREWDPSILAARADLERRFLAFLREGTAPADPVDAPDAIAAELAALARPPDGGVGGELSVRPDRDRLRELLVHRSVYHLKEADPQAWALPRLDGPAKSLLAAVEFDEYGGGDPARMHSLLFAELMAAFDLCPDYGHYLDTVAAPMLAVVNFMSVCGLHRSLRGALVGQLAVVESTSPLGSQRMLAVVQHLRGGPSAEAFYAEHAVADAVHEAVVREAIAELLAREPELGPDVLLGIRAAVALDERLDAHLLDRWAAGRSSLREPIRRGATGRVSHARPG